MSESARGYRTVEGLLAKPDGMQLVRRYRDLMSAGEHEAARTLMHEAAQADRAAAARQVELADLAALRRAQ